MAAVTQLKTKAKAGSEAQKRRARAANADKQRAFRERMRADGYRQITIWLSPENSKRVQKVESEQCCSVERAINDMIEAIEN